MLVVEVLGAALRSSRIFFCFRSNSPGAEAPGYAANIDQDTVAIVGSQAACMFAQQSTSIVRCTIDV